MSYAYIVLINGRSVYHFKLPFRLTEQRIREVCHVEIIPMDKQWAQVLLNDEFIYHFPVVDEDQIKFFDAEVQLME